MLIVIMLTIPYFVKLDWYGGLIKNIVLFSKGKKNRHNTNPYRVVRQNKTKQNQKALTIK